MGLLIPFVLALQLFYSLAVPVQPPPFIQLSSPPCNSSAVKAVAEAALNKLNAHRRTGYVFGLQRIFDVRELPQGPSDSLFYLTLDVLETNCHVLSRRLWKNCTFRPPHETVYGQCKTTVQVNKNKEFSFLYNYDCVLRPLPAAAIVKLCPDCPLAGDPTEAKFQEAAAESLAKFNTESNQIHYFALRNVTRATSQWVVGPSSFVEFVIQETSCPKSGPVPDLSKCPLLPAETAETGLCKGSLVNSQIEHRKFITIKCDFFPPQAQEDGEPQSGAQPGRDEHHADHESHEDDHHHHQEGKGHGHHHHNGGHSHPRGGGHFHHHSDGHSRHHDDGPPKHKKHHRDHSREDQEPQHQHLSSDRDQVKTVGQVIILPPSNEHVSLHTLPEIGAEPLDGKPVPPQVEEPEPIPKSKLLGSPSDPEKGSHPMQIPTGQPGLTKPTSSNIPPYPAGFSESDTCPGESTVNMLGFQLPQRPIIKTPPGGTQSQTE
ncbi:fetuin-B [Sceloporus undulatus]|uniref:fetuin-B n=1 Tax=Sceloporus undulatus TaxID=8520 RepID=UPI001C4CEB0C|nr:fetuin-B [Sceloporus undulatus]